MASVMESYQTETFAIEEHYHLLSVLMKQLPVVAFRRRNDPRWTMEQISEGCHELTGYDAHDLVDNHKLAFAEMIHPKDRTRVFDQARTAIQARRPFQLSFRILTAHGDERWVSEHSRPVENDDGNVETVEGIILDITEQKNAELHAVKEQHFSESVIDSLPGIFYMVDDEGHLLRWNHNAAAILGYSARELRQMNPIEFFDPVDQQRICRKAEEALKNGRAEFEATLVCKSGEHMPYFFTSVRTECSGRPTLIGMGIDISARKAAEDEVKALNRDLEARVARRTAALEVANHELEAFAYSVSHDLRAPLRHINAFAHILQGNVQDRLDDANRSNLEAIVSAAQRMDQLINDLLSLSRAGRQEMRLSAVSLEKMVELVRSELSPELMGRNIEWQIGPLPIVQADPSLLRQVFLNLLANAIKYSRPREQARIEIGAEEKEHEHVIFVRDNGVGFDPKYVHRLFGVFQRLHTDREFEGTGIGLAVVRRIVSRHGGATWAEGRTGQGATFYFTLPKAAEGDRH